MVSPSRKDKNGKYAHTWEDFVPSGEMTSLQCTVPASLLILVNSGPHSISPASYHPILLQHLNSSPNPNWLCVTV